MGRSGAVATVSGRGAGYLACRASFLTFVPCTNVGADRHEAGAAERILMVAFPGRDVPV